MNLKTPITLFVFSLLFIGKVSANVNQCHTFLPAKAQPVEHLKLCESAYTGYWQQYSCQDYQHGKERYRVIYRGGLIPKAIVTLNRWQQEQLIWSPVFGDRKMSCPLPPPNGMPSQASHRGTGVCQDDNDADVPCSVYEHKAARKTEYHRYMVYYQPNGDGAKIIDGQVAGTNKNAMVAELAYQLGRNLLETNCCSEQAMHYLEFAHSLFPRAEEYHAAYQQARSILAIEERH